MGKGNPQTSPHFMHVVRTGMLKLSTVNAFVWWLPGALQDVQPHLWPQPT